MKINIYEKGNNIDYVQAIRDHQERQENQEKMVSLFGGSFPLYVIIVFRGTRPIRFGNGISIGGTFSSNQINFKVLREAKEFAVS